MKPWAERTAALCAAALCGAAFFAAVSTGKYPLTHSALLAGDTMALRVFFQLRLPRAVMALAGGFGLGLAGFVYQTVFRNPLASPDVVGVASGACVGAAAGIVLFSSSAFFIMLCAFCGSLAAVLLAVGLAAAVPGRGNTIVLAGIAVHALAQTLLMLLKLMADPEKQLAAIEYWMMGSLSGVTLSRVPLSVAVVAVGSAAVFVLYRQIILLSMDADEAQLLGLPVRRAQLGVLVLATAMVAAVICVSGLVSFVGLLAPHIARLLTGSNRRAAMLLSGLVGSVLLLLADILAKTAAVELPVSIFTSLLGAPLFLYLVLRTPSERERSLL